MGERRFRADRLVEARRRSGLSQGELAKAVGAAGRERVSQWERGFEQPQPKQLRAVAEVLGVDPMDLLDVDPQAQTLRDLRIAAGMTLVDLRRAAGLPYGTYYRLENGVGIAPPSDEIVARVAEALGAPTEVVETAIARSRRSRARDDAAETPAE